MQSPDWGWLPWSWQRGAGSSCRDLCSLDRLRGVRDCLEHELTRGTDEERAGDATLLVPLAPERLGRDRVQTLRAVIGGGAGVAPSVGMRPSGVAVRCSSRSAHGMTDLFLSGNHVASIPWLPCGRDWVEFPGYAPLWPIGMRSRRQTRRVGFVNPITTATPHNLDRSR